MSIGDTYIYSWGNNPVRARLKGKLCKLLGVGKRNTALVEFEHGEQVVTSRRALRQVQKARGEV